jgi:prepilin-type N-terminal cleavage/methylation domain-containing protein
MKKTNRGFTLIEIMVVILIISILSAIVFAFISNQNRRALDKKIQQQVASMRSQAQLYTGTMSVVGYSTTPIVGVAGPAVGSNMFNDTTYTSYSLYKLINGLPAGTLYLYGWDGTSPANGGQWFFAAATSTGTVCADWKGSSKTTSATPTTVIATWSTVVNAGETCL